MTAQLIGAHAESDPAPLFRRTFDLDAGHGAVLSASLRLSAQGIIEAWVEGDPSSDELFNPGWTSYEWRTRVVEHDVTALVRTRTTLALRVGNGWYRGYLGFTGERAVYGEHRGAWAQLDIVFADGHHQVLVTDETWRTSTGAVVEDDFYRGQTIDARIDDEAWKRSGFDDADWAAARILAFDPGMLVERVSPPVRRIGELAPVAIVEVAPGVASIDFGQNLVGVVRLRVRGRRGTTVTVRHAEVLEGQRLATGPLRAATSTDIYTLSGANDTFEPTLTFHGFRYVEVSGLDHLPDADSVTAIVIGSDIPITGEFTCSDADLNRLHDNVVWGMRGNFLSVPTDCPQRDERLGWTGDLSVFAPTAAYLGDVASFLSDWLTDLALEQASSGAVPVVVPDALKFLDTGFPTPGATAVWGDAAIWVPWALWMAYGDPEILRTSYPSMIAHLDAVEAALTDDLWTEGFQFGDWLDPDAPPHDPGQSKADSGVVATACALRDAALLVSIASVLGHPDDAVRYGALRDRIGTAFRRAYWADVRLHSDCATVYALAIEFGLLDDHDRLVAGDRLAEIVRADRFRISTGFAGTPFLLPALSSTGHLEEAYRVLLNPEIPGWIYPVRMGATTIWERWDSLRPDGSVNPNGMTSFNHYAFGSVAEWMHRTIGGVTPLEPGYRRALVAPRPGGGLTSARTSTTTPQGVLAAEWSLDGDVLTATVDVPEGIAATLRLPGVDDEVLGAGRHTRRAATSAA